MKKLVVTRHPALVSLLIERGLVDEDVEVLTHVSEEDVLGCHVFGVLPLSLAAKAALVTEIPLKLTPDMRGKELTLEELKNVALEEMTYKVQSLSGRMCQCGNGEPWETCSWNTEFCG